MTCLSPCPRTSPRPRFDPRQALIALAGLAAAALAFGGSLPTSPAVLGVARDEREIRLAIHPSPYLADRGAQATGQTDVKGRGRR